MKKMGLLPKLVLAIIIGVLIGKTGMELPVRVLATFSGIFGNFLGFVIPLLIIGFVAPGIGDLGKGAGKLLGITAGIAYMSTVVAGTLAFAVNSAVLPKLITEGALDLSEGGGRTASALFTIDMPPVMGVMTALLIAFTIGLGMASIEGNALKNVMNEFLAIIEKVVKGIVIPLLPFHIAGIFAGMAYSGEAEMVMSTFFKVFIVILLLHFTMLTLQYFIAGMVSGTSPIRLIKNMVPAYLTAIGTQSSAATIPVTLNQTLKNGVKPGIAEFSVPLCATIHLSGSTITLTSCAMAVMLLTGMGYTFAGMFGFIMMLGVTMVAAPGVPGGAVVAALGLLASMLGFNEAMLGLMMALYMAQDSLGTACNVTGDGAIAILVNKVSGNKLEVKKEAGII